MSTFETGGVIKSVNTVTPVVDWFQFELFHTQYDRTASLCGKVVYNFIKMEAKLNLVLWMQNCDITRNVK